MPILSHNEHADFVIERCPHMYGIIFVGHMDLQKYAGHFYGWSQPFLFQLAPSFILM